MYAELYEIEERVDGKRVRRPANADEHRAAADLCRRAAAAARKNRERLLVELAKVDEQLRILDQAAEEHDSAAERG